MTRQRAQSTVEFRLESADQPVARQGSATAGRETNGLRVRVLAVGQERFPVQSFCQPPPPFIVQHAYARRGASVLGGA